MDDFIKQAEQNLVNIAASWEDSLKMIDALQKFGNKMCHEYIGRDEFFEGIHSLRSAIYREYTHALSNCFIFAGIGGEETAKYSRKKFEEAFDGKHRTMVMSFLEEHGQIPRRWKVADMEKFEEQARKKLKTIVVNKHSE